VNPLSHTAINDIHTHTRWHTL